MTIMKISASFPPWDGPPGPPKGRQKLYTTSPVEANIYSSVAGNYTTPNLTIEAIVVLFVTCNVYNVLTQSHFNVCFSHAAMRNAYCRPVFFSSINEDNECTQELARWCQPRMLTT